MAQSTFPRFPRGRLSQRLLDCLQNNSVFLQENLDPVSIVNELYANMILDENERENILGLESCRNSRQEQSRRLMSKLTMRTDRGFEAFVQALRDTRHEGAFRRIQEWLSSNMSSSSDTRVATQKDTSAESEHPESTLTDSAKQEALSQLQGRIGHVENRLDILSTRMTRLDPTSSQQQQKDEADELRRKLEEARQEIENLKHLLDYKSQDLEKAFEEVTKLEEHITKLKEEQKELEDKLRMEKKLRKDLEKQIKNHEKKMKEQDDKIKIQDITIKDQAKKNKIDKNKLLEQMHNMEIKLTEEMKRQQQEHRKEITVLAKSFQKLATQFEDQNKIVHEVQKKQSENEQASKSTNQVKNVCKVQLVDPAQSSGQRQRQTTHKPVTAAMTFSMKDNTWKRK